MNIHTETINKFLGHKVTLPLPKKNQYWPSGVHKMSNPVVDCEAILIYDLTGYRHFSSLFKQLEHYPFYGLVVAIPKEVPILGAETRVQIATPGVNIRENPTLNSNLLPTQKGSCISPHFLSTS